MESAKEGLPVLNYLTCRRVGTCRVLGIKSKLSSFPPQGFLHLWVQGILSLLKILSSTSFPPPFSWLFPSNSSKESTSGSSLPVHEHLITQSCPSLCDSMNYSPPGSSVHGIFQTRILEWVSISFSRGSCWPRDQTHVPHTHSFLPLSHPGGRSPVRGSKKDSPPPQSISSNSTQSFLSWHNL